MNKKKLRYAIAKEVDKGNNKLSEDDFGVTESQFDEAVGFLSREGYMSGFRYGDNRPRLSEGMAYLTEKGEHFLTENSAIAKTYKGFKEARDWIKF